MDKKLMYNEQTILLKHAWHPAPAEAVVSLHAHFAVFFTDGVCLIFSKLDLSFLRQITFENGIFRPVAVGKDLVAGITIKQRRLVLLNIKSGDIKHLCSVPLEPVRDEKHEWYYCNTIGSFRKTGNWMYREEAETLVCLKFFAVDREMASMKFKRESMKANKEVIDLYDDESRVAIYCSVVKRGGIKLEVFNSVDSSVKETRLANPNLMEMATLEKIRKLNENELLLCMAESAEKKSNSLVFVIMDILSQ